ncbi:hypothetical protein NC651_017519 [Populus alba x Populus x berolinensis]|nr:hypothetical protein NC651_017519 [Populus alba x Populus x berolinensis]
MILYIWWWSEDKMGSNSSFMELYAFACVMFCWVTWGYRMSFDSKFLPF